MSKRNQPPLVSTEAANRIRSFAHDLAALCKQYDVRIIWRSNGLIEVVDERRKCYPSGYECDASLYGCDSVGIFQFGSSMGSLCYVGIHIEDLQPEDWYSPEVAR